MTRPLLIPGETCATTVDNTRGGLLVDGRDFYRAFYDAACKAEHTILMAGWQFSSSVELLRGEDATSCDLPTKLIDLLTELCKRKPDLNIYMLPWDSSPIFTFEREPLQRLKFRIKGHKRIHWKMDNCHPPGASHHQKLIVIDRAIAFVGGMDICDSRWDDRAHEAHLKHRCSGSKEYTPYHDVQSYLIGDAVDVLRSWFCERWLHASGDKLDLVDCMRTSIEIKPTFDVAAPRVALARTWPKMETHAEIRELWHLHARAIGSAKQLIYIENQYYSSDEITQALVNRMRSDRDNQLEIVMVLPEKSAGFKERISIGVYQAELLERLTRVADETGHHFGVYYQVARGNTEKEEIPVFIHAKVLAVDDRFLLVSSANTSNRSMGYDTELGVAWEAPEATPSLRNARVELLAEHIGIEGSEFDQLLGPAPRGLVKRLDALATAKTHQLRIHRRNQDEKAGPLLKKLIPEKAVFDPRSPTHFKEGLLPERGTFLDRLIREPLSLLLGERGRKLKRRPG